MKIFMIMLLIFNFQAEAQVSAEISLADYQNDMIEIESSSKSQWQKLVVWAKMLQGIPQYTYAFYLQSSQIPIMSGTFSAIEWQRIRHAMQEFQQEKLKDDDQKDCPQHYKISVREHDKTRDHSGCAKLEKDAFNKLSFNVFYYVSGKRAYPAN